MEVNDEFEQGVCKPMQKKNLKQTNMPFHHFTLHRNVCDIAVHGRGRGGGLRGVAKRKQSYRCGDNGNRLCVQAYSFKLCDNLFILLSNLSSLFAIILLSAFTHRHTTTLAYYQQKASWKKL